MRKYILMAIPLILISCSTLSLKRTTADANRSGMTVTPNETIVSEIVKATMNSSIQDLDATAAPTSSSCPPQTPCPTCVALVTSEPSATPVATETPTVQVAEPKTIQTTATPTPNVAVDKIYQVQSSSPAYIPNFGHPDQGCNWLGVAGQAFDLKGNPIPNIVVIVDGKLNGTAIDSVAVTGMTSLYGPGGYEVVLGSKPVTSDGALTITLYGLNGVQQSDAVLFNTVENCQKNLTIINFEQIK